MSDDADLVEDEPASVAVPRTPIARSGARWRLLGAAAEMTGLIAVGIAIVLLTLDFRNGFVSSGAHAVLSAAPLALIAVAYIAHQALGKRKVVEGLKVALLAAAFLLWSSYQLFPNFRGAVIFNDLAIGLFVLDVAFILSDRSRRRDSL